MFLAHDDYRRPVVQLQLVSYLLQYSYVRFRHKAFYISDSDIGAHPSFPSTQRSRDNGARSYAEGWVSASRCKRKQAKRITFEASR